MKKIGFILYIFFFNCESKAGTPAFVLKGNIPGVPLSEITLITFIPLAPGNTYSIDSVLLHSDSFVIYGKLKTPHLFYLSIKANSLSRRSDLFFIDSGYHDMSIQYNDSVFRINSISNSFIQNEYLNEFLPFLFEKDKKRKEAEEDIQTVKVLYEDDNSFRDINDSILFEYIRIRPKSFIGFWFLYRRFLVDKPDKNKIYYEKFISLSSKIKESPVGLELLKLLKNENSLSIGRKFPQFILKGIDNKIAKVDYQGNSFTVIDYWSTWCGPCIREIPILKSIYQEYKSAKVNVISISVDFTKDYLKLNKFIDSLQMNWVHYWDENFFIANKYKIIFVPTYYLLNNKGEIIARSHRLQPIQEILKQNLK